MIPMMTMENFQRKIQVRIKQSKMKVGYVESFVYDSTCLDKFVYE